MGEAQASDEFEDSLLGCRWGKKAARMTGTAGRPTAASTEGAQMAQRTTKAASEPDHRRSGNPRGTCLHLVKSAKQDRSVRVASGQSPKWKRKQPGATARCNRRCSMGEGGADGRCW